MVTNFPVPVLRNISELAFSMQVFGAGSSSDWLRMVACTFDISIAAGRPLPVISATQIARRFSSISIKS